MFILIRALTYATIFSGFVLIAIPARVLSWSGLLRQPEQFGPLQAAGVIACAIALASVAVPQLAIFSVMSGETYFKTGSLPWAGFLTSAVIATALLYSAAETLERRDF